MILAAVRSGYPDAVLADAETLELTGLSDADADLLLRTTAPAVDATRRSRIREEAMGNPLALLELPTVGECGSTCGELRNLVGSLPPMSSE